MTDSSATAVLQVLDYEPEDPGAVHWQPNIPILSFWNRYPIGNGTFNGWQLLWTRDGDDDDEYFICASAGDELYAVERARELMAR